MSVEVILTEDDVKLGKRGAVVKVSHGYAYNFLIPHHKARQADANAVKSFEAETSRLAKKQAQYLDLAKESAKKIAQTSLTMEVSTGEGDKLYGAVTSLEIREELAKTGIALDKKNIQIPEPIRKLGAYQVVVKLHPEVSEKLKLWVVKKK